MRCFICTNLFDSGVEIVSTKCGHVFHSECLSKWTSTSKTCPECKIPLPKKSISKLYFNIPLNDDLDEPQLEDDMQTLKAKLEDKDVELKSSKKKLRQLKLRIAKMEKTVALNRRREMKLQHKFSYFAHMLRVKMTLEAEFKKLNLENRNLSKQIEQNYDITEFARCQKVVEEINRKMQSEVVTEIGNTASSRLATLCSVLKQEPRPVKEETEHLSSEETDIKERLDLSSASLQDNEKKVTKLDEQVEMSDKISNKIFGRNRALIANSNTSVLEETSENKSSTFSEGVSSKTEEVSVVVLKHTFPQNAVEKMMAPNLSPIIPILTLGKRQGPLLPFGLKTGADILEDKKKGKFILHTNYHFCDI